jgi:hypothetical protein
MDTECAKDTILLQMLLQPAEKIKQRPKDSRASKSGSVADISVVQDMSKAESEVLCRMRNFRRSRSRSDPGDIGE